jgi:hypothetical protein
MFKENVIRNRKVHRQNKAFYLSVIVSNNYPGIRGKIGYGIQMKIFLLECYFRNGVNKQPIKRLCIVSIIIIETFVLV